ncbi:MAG TPA: AraC family transcriptional regulator [Spirochaetia bacterium]|nr:AraC family transcriptional regulator [Spirochaetia bacterium]HRZ65388.1 AraC family transcriptional regulator [Spirochaetia bacterium]
MDRPDHVAAVEEAVDFIRAHLDEELPVERVADAACFSRHYFNRLFSSVTGEGVHSFARRLRLERAAFRLLKSPGTSLTEIAAEAGYSPSNFATAFRERFGTSASAYRAAPPPPPEGAYAEAMARIAALRAPGPERSAALAALAERVDEGDYGPFRLMKRRYRGPYAGLVRAWRDFCAEVEAAHPGLRDPLYVGISYEDPLITAGERLRYDLCADLPPGLPGRVLALPRRRYLRYRFEDQIGRLIHAFNDLLALGMPAMGRRLAEGPILELYRSGLDEAGRIAVDILAPIG